MPSNAKTMLKDLVAAAAASGRIEHPHPWQKYADMIRDSEGCIIAANAHGFTIPHADGELSVPFHDGMTKDHWDYFAAHLDEWSKTLLAKGILQNTVQPKSGREWDEALEPLRVRHGPDEEEWLPKLVEKNGFDAIAQEMTQALVKFRKATPAPSMIVTKDSTGLLHSDDYRVCKDKTGNAYNCTPVAAKLIEVLNLALKQGIPELNGKTLLKEALKQSATDSSLATQIKYIKDYSERLDHLFLRNGLWKTLVDSGDRKGCYKLVL